MQRWTDKHTSESSDDLGLYTVKNTGLAAASTTMKFGHPEDGSLFIVYIPEESYVCSFRTTTKIWTGFFLRCLCNELEG